MKNKITMLLLTACFCGSGIHAQPLPEQGKVLRTLIKVNDYYLGKYPDPRTPTFVRNKMRPSNIWTTGVYFEGLMALYAIYPQEKYYRYAIDWADYHKWSLPGGNTSRNADNQCCGQTYIELYRILPSPEKISNIKTCMNMLLNTPQASDWTWIDAIQMAMPVMAKMGKEFSDSRYFVKMYEMYSYTRNSIAGHGLFNKQEGLWWRDADFLPPYRESNGKNCYWSRGNGWVYAALVRVLSEIPADEKNRAQYLSDFLAMSEALRKCQREDAFWNASLHDPSNFGGKETTGTSLFVYGMAWGINNGILDGKTYLPAVINAWNALEKEAVHSSGFLGYVQGTGKEPKDSQPVTYDSQPDFDDFGVGCFLLAGSEIYKLK
jgi:rhamnogalacturonyl hydrolase YesR